jgi:soluble lytic murein transglycosylase-like protein
VDDFKKPKPSEMCPPGFHVVRGHERTCHSGTTTWVDSHIRRNRGKLKPGLLVENIHYLYWNSKRKFYRLPTIAGYKQGDKYDSLIQFWLEYWKSQGILFPADLDPLLIKALISVESDFNPRAKTKLPGSTASGLMQVTDQSLRLMAGYPNKKKWIEVRKHLIHAKKDDKLDPTVSVALGTRWLGHKFSKIPKRYPKNARSAVIGYHSFDRAGEAYADEVYRQYNKARGRK